jgi:hypothetical protein
MVYRTGLLLQKESIERYIQVETILAFYKQQFINTGKHLLFEDETFIGNATLTNDQYTLNGFDKFDQEEKDNIITFLKVLVVPQQQALTSAFGFGLQFNGELIYCEVILNAGLYEIWFNNINIAVLSQNAKCIWLQVTGEALPLSILRHITKRIESYYNQF